MGRGRHRDVAAVPDAARGAVQLGGRPPVADPERAAHGRPAVRHPGCRPPTRPTSSRGPPDALGVGAPLIWDHLIYAYLVESTGILPIFSEVVRRYVVGETLDAPSPQTLAWVRATEELFFRDPPLFAIGGVTEPAASGRRGQPAQRLLAGVRLGPAAPGARRRGRAVEAGRRRHR